MKPAKFSKGLKDKATHFSWLLEENILPAIKEEAEAAYEENKKTLYQDLYDKGKLVRFYLDQIAADYPQLNISPKKREDTLTKLQKYTARLALKSDISRGELDELRNYIRDSQEIKDWLADAQAENARFKRALQNPQSAIVLPFNDEFCTSAGYLSGSLDSLRYHEDERFSREVDERPEEALWINALDEAAGILHLISERQPFRSAPLAAAELRQLVMCAKLGAQQKEPHTELSQFFVSHRDELERVMQIVEEKEREQMGIPTPLGRPPSATDRGM